MRGSQALRVGASEGTGCCDRSPVDAASCVPQHVISASRERCLRGRQRAAHTGPDRAPRGAPSQVQAGAASGVVDGGPRKPPDPQPGSQPRKRTRHDLPALPTRPRCRRPPLARRGRLAGVHCPRPRSTRDRPCPPRRPGPGLGDPGRRGLALRPHRRPSHAHFQGHGRPEGSVQATVHGPGRRSWQAIELRRIGKSWPTPCGTERPVESPSRGPSALALREASEFAACEAAPRARLDRRPTRSWNAPSVGDAFPMAVRSLWEPDGRARPRLASRKRKAGPSLCGRPMVPPDAGGLGRTRTRRLTSTLGRADGRVRGLGRPDPPRRLPPSRELGSECHRDGRRGGHLPAPRGDQRHTAGLLLLPHAASLMLRAREDQSGHSSRTSPSPSRWTTVPGWAPHVRAARH